MAHLSACGFADGAPWATVSLDLSAQLDEAGRGPDVYTTRLDYAVSDVRIDMAFESARFSQAAAGTASSAAAEAFDPAEPPAGYSLCHNGHCHADSGELVAYEDIISGTAAAGADAGYSVEGALTGTIALSTAPQPVAFACADGCELVESELTQLSIETSTVRIQAHISDLRTEGRQRLTDDGLDLDVTLPALVFEASLAEDVGNGVLPTIEISADLNVSVAVFDAVDWSDAEWAPLPGSLQIQANEALISALGAATVDHTTLSTAIQRTKLYQPTPNPNEF